MTKVERLNNLKAEHSALAAKIAEVEQMLGKKTVEAVPMYEGSSRYDMASPGDKKIIGYQEATTYENSLYLPLWHTLQNKSRNLYDKIESLERDIARRSAKR